MLSHPGADHARPRDELDRLIRQHGVRRVMLSVLASAALHLARPRPPVAEPVPPHLRRDIGLPPLPEGRDYLRHL